MNIKPFQYLYPDYKRILKTEDFFNTIKNTFPDLRNEGLFLEGGDKSLFVYRIKSKLKTYHGILAAIDIQDYLKGLVKKHENTLTLQEENIGKLMIDRQAIIKPVLIAYEEQKKIKDLIARSFLGIKPRFKIEFDKEQQIHEFFEITDKKLISSFQKEFKSKVKKAYIADGHHRMAAICKHILQNPELSKKSLNYIMCALFDFNELSILPYNRLIRVTDVLDIDTFIQVLSKYADIKKIRTAVASSKKNEIIMISATQSYCLYWHKEVLQYFKQKNGIAFDIDIFNEIVLRDILGVQSIRSSDRVHYIEGIKPIKIISKSVLEQPDHVGFAFFPVRKRDFLKVADEHMVLPPKSTWFEPRIKNGIVIQNIELK